MECDKLSMQPDDCIEALAVVASVGMQGMGTVGRRLHLGRGRGEGGGSIYIGHDVMVTWDAEGCCRVEKIVMELRRCRGSVVAKNLPDQSVIRSFFCYVLGTVSKHRQYGSWRHGASPWQKTLHFRVLFQNFNTAIW